MSNTPSVATLVATQMMNIRMCQSTISFTKPYKRGKEVMASHDNASEDSYRASRSLIPKGFDTEYKALTKAVSACRAVFNKYTYTASVTANGDRAAPGDRLIRSKYIADGSFMSEWNQALTEFQATHQAFVYRYPQLVRDIEAASMHGAALGDSFDLADYPDAQQVREGFAITLEGPSPIADGSAFRTMPLDAETIHALEAQWDAQQRRALAVASQTLAKDMVEYLKTMATNLGKLRDYHGTPAHARGKAPSIYDSLVTNLQDAVNKAKDFAIPDTDSGSKLMDMIELIETTINPSSLTADYLKSAPYHAGIVADRAAELAQALAGEDWD